MHLHETHWKTPAIRNEMKKISGNQDFILVLKISMFHQILSFFSWCWGFATHEMCWKSSYEIQLWQYFPMEVDEINWKNTNNWRTNRKSIRKSGFHLIFEDFHVWSNPIIFHLMLRFSSIWNEEIQRSRCFSIHLD